MCHTLLARLCLARAAIRAKALLLKTLPICSACPSLDLLSIALFPPAPAPQVASEFWQARVFVKTFRERRSALAMYRAYFRVFASQLCFFQALQVSICMCASVRMSLLACCCYVSTHAHSCSCSALAFHVCPSHMVQGHGCGNPPFDHNHDMMMGKLMELPPPMPTLDPTDMQACAVLRAWLAHLLIYSSLKDVLCPCAFGSLRPSLAPPLPVVCEAASGPLLHAVCRSLPL